MGRRRSLITSRRKRILRANPMRFNIWSIMSIFLNRRLISGD